MASNHETAALMEQKKKNKKILIGVLIGVAVVLLAGFFFLRSLSGSKKPKTTGSYRTKAVETRSITNSLTGSGTLLPANSYTVTTLVEGDVLEADFEEGDIVEKDTVLYRIDDSDAANNIEKAEISLAQSKRNYTNNTDKQYAKATVAGVVQTLEVNLGDTVTKGQLIATIRDNSVMTIKVPFAVNDADSFYVGQEATVILDNTFETLTGTVQTIADDSVIGEGNIAMRNVTVAVSSPGSLTDTQAASVNIAGRDSMANAMFTYRATASVTAEASGTITKISAGEGSYVAKDQILCTIGGKDMEETLQSAAESLRNAEISISSTRKSLENYTITSPIKGTIVDKQYKKGDTIEEKGKTLCIIYDLEYLEMTLYIDELDISKIAVGQEVAVTAEAVSGKSYSGVVTKVSVAGSTSNNTTVYPVTVRIDETEGLLPGMNVDAEIVLSSAENVLAVPGAAIARGNVVLLTKDSPSAVNAMDREAPEGYVYVKVEIGISDDDYTEIKSGLQEGDTVAYGSASNQSSAMSMGMAGHNAAMQGMGMGGMGGGNNRSGGNYNRTGSGNNRTSGNNANRGSR